MVAGIRMNIISYQNPSLLQLRQGISRLFDPQSLTERPITHFALEQNCEHILQALSTPLLTPLLPSECFS